MATIEKRRQGNKAISYRAKIRRKGHRVRTASFETRGEAEAWARRVESKIDSGSYIDGTEARETTR